MQIFFALFSDFQNCGYIGNNSFYSACNEKCSNNPEKKIFKFIKVNDGLIYILLNFNNICKLYFFEIFVTTQPDINSLCLTSQGCDERFPVITGNWPSQRDLLGKNTKTLLRYA